MIKYIGLVLVGAMVAFGAGCGDDSNGTGGTGGTAGMGGTGGTGGGGVVNPIECDSPDDPVDLEGSYTENRTMLSTCTYRLVTETFIESGTMFIQPGTTIIGNTEGAFIVTTGGRVVAEGTADAPIVFTSSAPVGERSPGDWGGFVMLGTARINSSRGGAACDGEAGNCQANIEGLSTGEARGLYGGNDDAHDCGSLRYVRVEFAGRVVGANNELNSVTVAGCGTETTLSFVQAHRGLDDAFEFFGGKPVSDHLLATGMGDDGLDWDNGYTGTVDQVIVHGFAPATDDPRGFETDNDENNNDALPRSAPIINYGTVVNTAEASDRGIVNRRGTWGQQSDLIVVGWPNAGYDMRDSGWAEEGGWPTGIFVRDSCFFDNNPNYPVDFNDPENCDPQTDCFPEDTALPEADLGNLEVDPGIGDISAAETGVGTPDYTITNTAQCTGGTGPDNENWVEGWAAFPAD